MTDCDLRSWTVAVLDDRLHTVHVHVARDLDRALDRDHDHALHVLDYVTLATYCDSAARLTTDADAWIVVPYRRRPGPASDKQDWPIDWNDCVWTAQVRSVAVLDYCYRWHATVDSHGADAAVNPYHKTQQEARRTCFVVLYRVKWGSLHHQFLHILSCFGEIGLDCAVFYVPANTV